MTRRVDWEDWRRQRRRAVVFSPVVPLRERGAGRHRTPEEWAVLKASAVAAVRRREAEGRLVWIDSRHATYTVRRHERGAASACECAPTKRSCR